MAPVWVHITHIGLWHDKPFADRRSGLRLLGTAGLACAIELARRGVSFRLIEKIAIPFPGSRGKGIQPRTQEIFEDLGILDQGGGGRKLYPRQRTYRADGSYLDSDIAEHVRTDSRRTLSSAL